MTTEEFYAIFCRAKRLNLSGWETLTPANIKAHCNGIGADWMPDAMRRTISALNPSLRLPAAIHDIGYGYQEQSRKYYDRQFMKNCMICIKANYQWFNPLRYIVMVQALNFYRLLRHWGGLAWEHASVDNRS